MGMTCHQVVGDPEAAISISVETMKHLRAVMAVGPRDGDCWCNWCGGERESPRDTYQHEPDCPWVEAKAFLDGIDKPD